MKAIVKKQKQTPRENGRVIGFICGFVLVLLRCELLISSFVFFCVFLKGNVCHCQLTACQQWSGQNLDLNCAHFWIVKCKSSELIRFHLLKRVDLFIC
jgi:hypothetical protein